jgi:hypothetical protein
MCSVSARVRHFALSGYAEMFRIELLVLLSNGRIRFVLAMIFCYGIYLIGVFIFVADVIEVKEVGDAALFHALDHLHSIGELVFQVLRFLLV